MLMKNKALRAQNDALRGQIVKLNKENEKLRADLVEFEEVFQAIIYDNYNESGE